MPSTRPSTQMEYRGGRGFSTPSRKLEFYSETLLEHGYTPLPEHREPLIGPLVRPDLGARFHPLADEHR